MRCLQCGKDLPLLKRMAGSEFCSDAHRREYQKEYSDLALGRLLQSKPPGLENSGGLNGTPALVTPPPPANGHMAPPPSVTLPVAPKLEPVVAATKTVPLVSPDAAKKTEPATPIALPSAPEPAKKVEPDPAVAKVARVDKPAPADVPLLIPRRLAFEEPRSQRPGAPFHEASVATAALLEADPLPLGRGVEVADVAIHAIERELELRELARPAPWVELDVRITGPEAFEVQREALAIPPMSSVAPEDASLWTAERREFAGSLISLGSLAGYGLSTTGFEEPRVEAPAPAAVEAEPATIPIEPPVIATEPIVEERGAAAPPVPEMVLEQLPVIVQGIAAGRAKPGQVFGAALFTEKTVQVPPPSGLPLRPLMVLGPAESAAAPVTGKKTKSDVRILPPAAVKPNLPVATAAAPVSFSGSVEPDLGLPELRLESGRNGSASHMPKIAAAVAGAAALGLGIFFFLGRGETRLKPAAETTITSANWISNFATDAKSQRRVSVLRASMGLAAYRLDFESSIQIKGLGWVYRAQDAKNYYVSKIELEKPGQNPEFAIVHYAVIDGVEQPHEQKPLRVGVPLGGRYKIRFEAVGDRFTTWVQGQQVDQWMDGRLKSGGAGLYREGAEQSTLHGDFQVTPLAK
ncbi:MAG TPA: hypothetical protein VLM42_08395 [Bryobacteraceae bacterium]|nr:hypothetical protein [Bryobacteraceae bacterium]